jgi:peptide/nickel transport system permease protein
LTRFVAQRLAGLVATLVAASFVIFAALYVAPGDPIAFLTGGRTVSPQTIAALRAEYHLNDPLPVAYVHWLAGALHGDFGRSVLTGESVSSLLAPRILNTAMLLVVASLLILLVGLGTGIAAGLRRGAVDTTILLGSTVALAVPSFVVAIVLITIFAVDLHWFPVFGSGTNIPDRLYHLVLPSLALALASMAFVGRVTRSAVRSELDREHVQTAISRGIPYPLVVRRHVVRNALIPITTVGGLTVAGLIAGAAIVERAFNLNGLGGFLVQEVQAKDFPVAQAICMILVAAFVIVNVAVDVIYTLVDPRLKARSAR